MLDDARLAGEFCILTPHLDPMSTNKTRVQCAVLVTRCRAITKVNEIWPRLGMAVMAICTFFIVDGEIDVS